MVVFSARDSSRHEMALIQASLRTVAARLAAMNASDAAIDRMQRHLDEADRLRHDMSRSMRDGAEYPADLAERLLLTLRVFHTEMEASCGNAVLLRPLSTVTTAPNAADDTGATGDTAESGDTDAPPTETTERFQGDRRRTDGSVRGAART
jgi:DNA-binding GntR family transcriptional regulator